MEVFSLVLKGVEKYFGVDSPSAQDVKKVIQEMEEKEKNEGIDQYTIKDEVHKIIDDQDADLIMMKLQGKGNREQIEKSVTLFRLYVLMNLTEINNAKYGEVIRTKRERRMVKSQEKRRMSVTMGKVNKRSPRGKMGRQNGQSESTSSFEGIPSVEYSIILSPADEMSTTIQAPVVPLPPSITYPELSYYLEDFSTTGGNGWTSSDPQQGSSSGNAISENKYSNAQ